MTLDDKLEPSDLIAVVALIGGFALKALGHNGDISLIMITVISYYFGYSTYKRAVKDTTANGKQT